MITRAEPAFRCLRVVALRSRSGAYGGPADTALNQAQLVCATDYQVTLFSTHLKSDEPQITYRDGLEEISVRSRLLFKRLGFATLYSWKAPAEIWKQVGRTDIVHISFAREPIPILAAAISLLLNRPLIVQPHGMLTSASGFRQRILDRVAKPLYKRAAGVISLTQDETRRLQRWQPRDPESIYEIGNPPLSSSDDCNTTPSAALRKREAIFIARLEKRKRVVNFAAAALESEKNSQEIGYRIVGPDQGELSRLKPLLTMSDSLRYEGALPARDIPQRLSESSVFVLPSKEEPWGNVLVTAISIGLPVVATRSAALASEIELQGAGIIVDDDNPSQISRAVEALLNSPERWLNTSKACKEMFRNQMSNETIEARLRNAYMLVAKSGTRRSDSSRISPQTGGRR